ncbi:Histone-lysine N-methyltransferase SETMAR [Dictyocoela muelleri]|nr:Histone-lysine N-methyltransferase SETMAR [Dictyocoela muelleri]
MREYAFSFSRYVGRNILFVDESGSNLHTSISYGYAPPNVRPIKHQPASKGHNISLCAIISRSTLVSSKIIDGGYNAEKYGKFIDESARFGAFRDSPILVMDNASIHNTREIISKLEVYGVEVKFLPPYSPDLFSFENFF